MSKEYQASPASHASFSISVSNYLSLNHASLIAFSNPFQLPQQASPCVGAQELIIPRWGVLSQPWQLPSWTPYGTSVPYKSYGNLAISIIIGQIGPLIFSGLSWSFHSWGQPVPFTIIRPFQAVLCFWAISVIFQ
ncbi:hypothetical protein O181_124743 [Austropuccinia psidii MF-1]|uniref:Uncharacterized protein n=1 Tax=Austropuccinia psidii MF-1 TaxID=1389203 RepID=A0A9Q3KNH2_9BASI|nr:hypothetical protein [Austropuccinia psidii MF-1]